MEKKYPDYIQQIFLPGDSIQFECVFNGYLCQKKGEIIVVKRKESADLLHDYILECGGYSFERTSDQLSSPRNFLIEKTAENIATVQSSITGNPTEFKLDSGLRPRALEDLLVQLRALRAHLYEIIENPHIPDNFLYY